MQNILVIITFVIAVGFIANKFVIAPIMEKKKVRPGSVDGGKTNCGSNNCGCN